MSFARARRIADAVLYEGYVLYPYRASAAKNRMRWNFGVLAPRDWSEADGCESWWSQTECLAEVGWQARLEARVRFLQLSRRRVEARRKESFEPVESLEAGGRLYTTWDEGEEREVELEAEVSKLVQEQLFPILLQGREVLESIPGEDGGSVGRVRREACAVRGMVRLSAEPREGGLVRIRIRVENETPWERPGAPREEVLPGCLIGVHVLARIQYGRFVSLLDPPPEAAGAAAACENVRTWPVLAGPEGDRSLLLSSPIVLYDHPQVADESPGPLYDSTEIDEILTLRTQTLTEAEKREARATDPRAAEVIERCETLPDEWMERLHGAVRELRPTIASPEPDPGDGQVEVRGCRVSRGSRVRLKPGRRADAQDLFLADRIGRVEGVFEDVDGITYVGVTLEDDPAADLHEWYGRYLYFYPDEIEPLPESGS